MDTPPKTKAQMPPIQALSLAGYTLFPCDGKYPQRGCMWADVAPGAFGLHNIPPGGNYGVALKPGDLVIDVDPRNALDGDKPLARLIADIGVSLNNTFVVQTGGGGLHIYLRKPADILVRKTMKEKYKGIDFLSAGCYVVGPGSVHPDTKQPYRIVSGPEFTPFNIAAAPAALLEIIKRAPAPDFSEVAGIKTYDDGSGAIARFRIYLESTAPIAKEGDSGDATTYAVACCGRDFGLSPAVVYDAMDSFWNLRCIPPWSPEDLKAKVIHAFKYASRPLGNRSPKADFEKIIKTVEEQTAETQAKEAADEKKISWVLDKNNNITKCFYNLLNYFKVPSTGLYKVFGYNEFTANIEFTHPAPWHKGVRPRYSTVRDQDLKLLKAHLAVKHSYEARCTDLEEAISVTANAHRFHPVREYLLGLQWDGKQRIDTWLCDFGHAKNTPYVRAAARKILCAAVGRVMKPGCKFDHMLVLEGAQGIGKSQMCKALGGDWYGDFIIDPHNKDTIQSLQGKWIVEMSEMEVTRRTDANALKAFISRDVDKARLAYGRFAEEYPRQCVFIGTINPEADGTYLKDSTGNRRFWPVELRGKVDLKGLRETRNQLFAEAVAALRAGETLYFDQHAIEDEARIEAAERHAEHPWTERIAEWLEVPVVGGGIEAQDIEGAIKREFVTGREVFIEAIGGTDRQFDRHSSIVIADIMLRLRWEKGSRRQKNGPLLRGYRRPSTPAEKAMHEGLKGILE